MKTQPSAGVMEATDPRRVLGRRSFSPQKGRAGSVQTRPVCAHKARRTGRRGSARGIRIFAST